LIIGDSISFGYTPYVTTRLEHLATVERIEGSISATLRPKGGLRLDTHAALERLDAWLGDGKWDVIHFNWGLHDVKIEADGRHQVPLTEYEANLRLLVARLQKTGATLIWASTTPVPQGTERGAYARKAGDEIAYNDAAAKIMRAEHVVIDDLHELVMPRLAEVQLPANVHFKDEGYRLLGNQVADAIGEALRQRKR
jgi:acyl-CoA thioesterase-1